VEEIRHVLLAHLDDHYRFYGMDAGARIARKHIAWYTKGLVGSAAFRRGMNQLNTAVEQVAAIDRYFGELSGNGARLVYDDNENAEEALAA